MASSQYCRKLHNPSVLLTSWHEGRYLQARLGVMHRWPFPQALQTSSIPTQGSQCRYLKLKHLSFNLYRNTFRLSTLWNCHPISYGTSTLISSFLCQFISSVTQEVCPVLYIFLHIFHWRQPVTPCIMLTISYWTSVCKNAHKWRHTNTGQSRLPCNCLF